MLTAIVQARMTSTRLPGKVLKEVLGRPLLSYLVERLQRVAAIEQIVIATTTNATDDAIADFCKKNGIAVFRGSEDDVLDRYAQAAKTFNADPIIRITGDCPLIALEVVGRVIQEFQSGSYDYVVTGPSFTEGFDCEIFSAKMLQLSAEGASKKSEREHITLYMNAHPEVCKKLVLGNSHDDSGYRVAVDEPVDFTVVQAILEAVYPSNPTFTGQDVKNYLDTHPDVAGINGHVVRNEGLLKSLAAET